MEILTLAVSMGCVMARDVAEAQRGAAILSTKNLD